jgi:DNA-binding MarR family transcriptional regulator
MKETNGYLLNQIAGMFWVNLEKFMAEIGIHAGQVFVLNALWEADGQSQAEIVRNLQVTAPTVYNMIVRLEKAGYVETRQSSQDARARLVFLTRKGFEIRPEVERQWSKLENLIFSELNETEKTMLSLLLKKLEKS